MRPLKIKIEIFKKSEGDLIGEENVKIVEHDCIIDLDRAEGAWIDWDGELVICMASGEAFRTKSYTYKQFVDIWTCGLPAQGVEPQTVGPSVQCSGSNEPCAFCGGTDIVQEGNSQHCDSCGMSWTSESNKQVGK